MQRGRRMARRSVIAPEAPRDMANKTQKRTSHEARKPKAAAGKGKGKTPGYLRSDDSGPGEFLDKAAARRIGRK
jgi:hypothetical protein